ncbi:hypothetical protein YYG_04291 [Plasmodium vinckei petteri]|uniref:Uncharacterized protein n=1 Tax=Plasmodium vinckei petteri TaxID=138298 RepID=W7AAS5_PLAVN|nr:hypothetical protein YYG_04291 [Plasmodium vinckei petteri]CAD2112079.1 conserved Plasmodium protein, unknown function [Plasmodium vinckei petteri]
MRFCVLKNRIKKNSLTICRYGNKNIHTETEQNEKKVDIIEKLVERYKHLRNEDRMKLINSHLENIKEKNIDIIYEFTKKKEEKEIKEEYENKRKAKLLKLRKPAYLQPKNVKKKINNEFTIDNKYEELACSEKENELKPIEKYTLVEDVYKAYIYSKAFSLLNNKYITKHKISNDFNYIMINSIKKYLLEKIKPALINEFSVYTNPYMLLKNSLHNLILHEHVKNCYDESLIENYINKKTSLNILKINSADVPVEVYEPLVSFHGNTHYNYNVQEKFKLSINTFLTILDTIQKGGIDSTNKSEQSEQNQSSNKMEYEDMSILINDILKKLPENIKYPFANYPFENFKSFKTNIKKKYIGGIKNNKPANIEDEEIAHMRYPNLQCVSHSLPKDKKYRDNVIHAIKVLERSKHWDHNSKIKAINTLVEVWNNMNKSEHYEQALDKALPSIYTKNMLRKTRTRKDTYNKGLSYIQSLTTQKPLHARSKKN